VETCESVTEGNKGRRRLSGCHELNHYPLRLVIFGKYHFEKPIMLFPIVLATFLWWRIFPSRSCSHAIFTIATFVRPSLYGVSRQHKPTKVIPKTTQVMQFSVGKKWVQNLLRKMRHEGNCQFR